MSSKHLFPIHYYRDASGNPLAGGLIYTYISQTSTGKYTYADNKGDTLLSNPVKLDNSGRADIWMDTDVPYRLIIKDKDGNQIGSTIDEVVPTVAQPVAVGASNLDITGYSIITTSNDDIRITPDGIGKVYLYGAYKLPNELPAVDQVLTGTGTSTLIWSASGAVNFNGLTDVNASSPSNGYMIHYVTASTEWQGLAHSALSWTAARFSDLNSVASTFTNKTGAISQWTNDSGYAVNANIPAAAMAFTNKTGNISQWTNDSGYNNTPEVSASQSDMETATSSSTIVRPGKLQNHPGVAKAWILVRYNGTAPVTVLASYNCTAAYVADFFFDVSFTTSFSNTNYTITSIADSTDESYQTSFTNKATNKVRVGLNLDTTMTYSLMFYGDQ